MTTYRIESEAGVVLGDYEGADEAEARATVGGTVTVTEVQP